MAALRDVYGKTLKECAEKNGRIVALDADLANNSKSCEMLPELKERHFDVGIAEANMIAMAAGFASCGFVPFVNTFSTLAASMCLLTVKALIGYSGLNVRLVGSNTGLCGGYDGATHHCFDDVNVMRAIPGLTVMVPSDAQMVKWAVGTLADTFRGPVYMGVSRNASPDLYAEDESFEIGKAKRLRGGADVTIIACGMAVARAYRAAEELEREGIHAGVIDMFTIKPLDRGAVIAAAKRTGAIVTAEEHSIIGGLGSSVLEVLAEERLDAVCERVGIRDVYTQSGSYQQLVEMYRIDAGAIAEAAKRAVSKKER